MHGADDLGVGPSGVEADVARVVGKIEGVRGAGECLYGALLAERAEFGKGVVMGQGVEETEGPPLILRQIGQGRVLQGTESFVTRDEQGQPLHRVVRLVLESVQDFSGLEHSQEYMERPRIR